MNTEQEKFSENLSEKSDQSIVEKNLTLLETSMVDLLMTESLGGNAGSIEIEGKEYICGGANGYANEHTGEINAFGNIQDLPEEIVKNNSHFILRVAVDVSGKHHNAFFKIVSAHGLEDLNDKAANNINRAIERYNLKSE